MTKPLVSLLLPTRKRVPQLRRCLDSVYDNCTQAGDTELFVKIDDDDEETKAITNELVVVYGAKLIISPREAGYGSLGRWLCQMEDAASGTWSWMLNDDMTVERGDWLGELRKVPTTGYIVHPEQSRLGGSIYFNAENQAFPIWPRHCWKPFGEILPAPADTQIHIWMVNQAGWKTWFMKGVVLWHQRGNEEKLARERIL